MFPKTSHPDPEKIKTKAKEISLRYDNLSKTEFSRENLDTERKTGKMDQSTLRAKVLFCLFLEKFLETSIVLMVTILAATWKPLSDLIEDNIGLMEAFIIVSMVMLILLRGIPYFGKCPGCFILNFFHLITMITMFALIVVYFPILFDPFISSYFVFASLATAAATYFLIAILAIARTVNGKGSGLWVYGAVMPMVVLALSQAAYFYGGNGQDYADYKIFMMNISSGAVFSLLISGETLFFYQKFVNSDKLQEIATIAGLISEDSSKNEPTYQEKESGPIYCATIIL